MQKIKFDFEATKQLIYAPNSTAPIGAPVDADGNVANDGTAIGIVLCRKNENDKYWVKQNLVVMVAGYCDIIDAQAIWGDEYSAEAMAAMSDITFCDNHQLPTGGGGGGLDLFVVNVTNVEEMEGATVLSFDKTYDEIRQAVIDSPKPVVCAFEGAIYTVDYTTDHSVVFKWPNVILDNDGTLTVSVDVITIYEVGKGILTFVGEFSYSADE